MKHHWFDFFFKIRPFKIPARELVVLTLIVLAGRSVAGAHHGGSRPVPASAARGPPGTEPHAAEYSVAVALMTARNTALKNKKRLFNTVKQKNIIGMVTGKQESGLQMNICKLYTHQECPCPQLSK